MTNALMFHAGVGIYHSFERIHPEYIGYTKVWVSEHASVVAGIIVR